MGTLIFLFILFKLITNPSDRRHSDLYKLFISGSIGFAALSVILGLVGAVGSVGLGPLGIVALIFYYKYANKQKNESRNQNRKYKFDGKVYEDTSSSYNRRRYEDSYSSRSYNSRATSNGKLPKSQKGRRAIIEAFDKKYDLYLTEEQINSIVSSTYLSELWKREVEAMDEKYETIHQWFVGPTAWLRLYIHAFIPQEITSDFAQQEKIVIYSFDQVFTYVESLGGIPLKEKIARVNDKFFAQFDDITFMAAFRYLESKGIRHNLEVADPLNTSSYMDDLINKYEGAEA